MQNYPAGTVQLQEESQSAVDSALDHTFDPGTPDKGLYWNSLPFRELAMRNMEREGAQYSRAAAAAQCLHM